MSASAQSTWAARLIDGFARAGVREVIISPGSRSAPLVLAAAAHAALRCKTIVDERAAGFYALGQVRVSGRPSMLLCTSGTAGAHYFPDVIEASNAQHPLVVLTADRPPELHHRGAAQTIEQSRLYGAHARAFFELGAAPAVDEDAWSSVGDVLARTAALIVQRTRDPLPGPVHVNAWMRKPLEPPEETAVQAIAETPATTGRPLRAWGALREPDPSAVEALSDAIRQARRPMIVAGPAPLAARGRRGLLARVCRLGGFVVAAEAVSQLRLTGQRGPWLRLDGADWLLQAGVFLPQQPPDLLMQIGSAPVGRGWQQWLASKPPLERFVVAPCGWHDPFHHARAISEADVDATLGRVAERLEHDGISGESLDETWRERCARAEQLVWEAVDTALDAPGEPFGEPHAVRTVLEQLPAGSLLALGNSLPVREVDLFARGGLVHAGVVHQRGASGIDGLISAAAGAASLAGTSVTLLIGDLTLLHDASGLALSAGSEHSLVVVVLDNGGGRMFELLPIGARDDLSAPFREHFIARQAFDPAALAEAFGCRYARAAGADSLRAALARAYAAPGATLVHVPLPGERTAVLHQHLRRSVGQALAALERA
ncbi:MAG: 2-succinyl-5-enolpyruvyl-6-hydroxy-3-cyclohexene-1-carboxylic-acid synthase [Acidobacteriota bacterium]|nr:MAG: 2-succinyl-5-enolpyruvyl-6-hydroxy-3-cyclohexene-1-carboxylic-acid synthase [Acidobacteriota bacterium]